MLDIDVKGARDIHKSDLVQCNYVFVKTPSIDELRSRLIERKTETEETLAKRIRNAESEIAMAESLGIYNKIFINDDRERFVEEATKYILRDLYQTKEI